MCIAQQALVTEVIESKEKNMDGASFFVVS